MSSFGLLTMAKLQKISEVCNSRVSQIAQNSEFALTFDQFTPILNSLTNMFLSFGEFRLGSLRKMSYFCSVRLK